MVPFSSLAFPPTHQPTLLPILASYTLQTHPPFVDCSYLLGHLYAVYARLFICVLAHMTGSRHLAPPSLTRTTRMVTQNPIMLTPSATVCSLDSHRPSSSVLTKQMSQSPSDQSPVNYSSEESLEARIERLGRQRPDEFNSLWAEIGFVFSICMSQVLSVRAIYSCLCCAFN